MFAAEIAVETADAALRPCRDLLNARRLVSPRGEQVERGVEQLLTHAAAPLLLRNVREIKPRQQVGRRECAPAIVCIIHRATNLSPCRVRPLNCGKFSHGEERNGDRGRGDDPSSGRAECRFADDRHHGTDDDPD